MASWPAARRGERASPSRPTAPTLPVDVAPPRAEYAQKTADTLGFSRNPLLPNVPVRRSPP